MYAHITVNFKYETLKETNVPEQRTHMNECKHFVYKKIT